ncbi:MAG: ATP-binding protein [Ktedonobacteraceae bacterium]
MERLNDIINRTAQRRQQGGNQQESRGQQGQRSNAGQHPEQPPARRPMPEQTARLGQRRVPAQQSPPQSAQSVSPTRKYYQHAPHNRALPEPDYSQRPRYPQREIHETYGSDEMNAAQTTRQLYSYEYEQERERAGEQTPRQNAYGDGNVNNASKVDNTGSTGYYRTPRRIAQTTPPADEYYDAYPVSHQADVQEEWEDDAVVMRYGDWEDDMSDQSSYQSQRPNRGNVGEMDRMGAVPTTNYPHYPDQPSAPREMPPTHRREREIESHPPTTSYSTAPRNLQAMPSQLPPSRLPVSSTSLELPVPQAMPQEMRSHRNTQPLDPQIVVNMTREMSQEQRRTPQPIRLPDGQSQTTNAISSLPVAPCNVCSICKGAGYLRANVPVGDPNFGKPVPCACKEAEWREKRRQQLLELSDLSAFQHRNFDNFRTQFPGAHSSVKRASEESRIFSQNPNGWLVLIGPNGCGKTHLAAAIANRCLKEGSVVLFTVVPELLAHLRSTFGPNATEAYDQRFAKMREAELLVLDDLGAHQSSAWTSEKLFQLLNYRYNSGFPTVITANKQGLMGLDERILSRMSDTALVITVEMNGAVDYRRQNPRRESRR